MIKAVLFDLDGVLVDACDWHYVALNRALNDTIHWYIGREDHESTYNGLPTKVKLNMLVKKGLITEHQIESISALKQEKVIEIIEEKCKEDPTKILMIQELWAKGIKLGCVTNSIRKTTEMMLEKIGILDHFDVIVTNEDIVNPKPNPEGYIGAAIKLGLTTEECAIVEDSEKGLIAANNVPGALVIEVKDATEVDLMLMDDYGII